MIQLNLLPDVKLDYIKTRRTKRMVTLTATLVASVSVGLLVLLFVVVNILQKQHINNLTDDIAKDSTTLQQTPDLNKILTIQNQLNALPELHDKKPKTSRLFNYIKQVVPNNVSVSQLDVDYTNMTLTFTGNADDIEDVNRFVDTLKFTNYKSGETETDKAFTEVVLSSFSRGDDTTNYQIAVKYNPVIFDATRDVGLEVPEIVTTRSQTEKPSALFNQEGN